MKTKFPQLQMILFLSCVAMAVAGSSNARAEIIERVVAIVNDDPIFLSKIRQRAAPLIAQALDAPDQKTKAARLKSLYQQALKSLVDEKLFEQTARDLRIFVSTADIDKAIDNVRTQNGLSKDAFWSALQDQGINVSEYRKTIRSQLLRYKVLNQKVRSRVRVTQQEVDDRIRKLSDKAQKYHRFLVDHIFIPFDASSAEQDKTGAIDKTTAQANQIRKELTAENFSEYAERIGGGSLGWLDQYDISPTIVSALLGLEDQEISQPVSAENGVHIFLLREHELAERTASGAQLSRDNVYRQLLEEEMARQEQALLEQLRNKATIDMKTKL